MSGGMKKETWIGEQISSLTLTHKCFVFIWKIVETQFKDLMKSLVKSISSLDSIWNMKVFSAGNANVGTGIMAQISKW